MDLTRLPHTARPRRVRPQPLVMAVLAASVCALSGCAQVPQVPQLQSLKTWWSAPGQAATQDVLAPARDRSELLLGVTDGNEIVTFQASEPGKVLTRLAIRGLSPNEHLLGVDFRVAKGQLYGLSNQGRLLRIDTDTGQVSALGSPVTLPTGDAWGVDFNPTVDRIRVVNGAGHNLRLHPDTGAQVDGQADTPGVQADGPLAYTSGDLLEGVKPRIVAAAYTYNKVNEKITTNYAVDAGAGYLAIQGSLEGAATLVSPNTGRLQAVGPLLIERFDDASFDICDVNNNAYLSTTRQGTAGTKLYELNLSSGQARLIGAVGGNLTLKGLTVVP